MQEINVTQSAFYDSPNQHRNFISAIWAKLRGRLSNFRTEVGVRDAVYDLHRSWLGDLSDKSVLDLGCGRGNFLSIELAQRSKSYLAIDLSHEAIASVQNKLDQYHIPHARAEALDFLSPDFTEKFDVIYAYGVMHHFRYFDAFLGKVVDHLNPGGYVISHDPTYTSLFTKIVRDLYRPFQSDREWEWPFTRESFQTIQTYFDPRAAQGFLGDSKWAIPPYFVFHSLGARLGKRLHQRDMQRATEIGKAYHCLHISLYLEPKS